MAHTFIRKPEARQRLVFHDGPLPFFSFPHLDEAGVLNGVTTKYGGVSTGCFAALNMACLKEPAMIVQENYRRVAQTLGFDENRAVLSYQTHSAGIRTVLPEDAGKGPFSARDYTDTDGLVTDIPGMTLTVLSADCPLLLFYDPVNRAIGAAHSGWRGTVAGMAQEMVRRMHYEFNTAPEDLLAGIAPSICRDCYEVSSDVAEQFEERYGHYRFDQLADRKENGKFQLDLWKANEFNLLEAGVDKKNIF
ncbi:MAG: laccase domain-containing protein, partial [Lachnospiraceae bacterium]|nr:laccase domain-containing protein [Lachnospiraceae bacterium]